MKKKLKGLLVGAACGLISVSSLYADPKPPVKYNPRTQPRKRTIQPIYKNPDLSGLTSDISFSEAIDIFRNSTQPPLNILVLWKDIEENSDVTKATTIGMNAISGISLGDNLKYVLMTVSSNPKSLGYVVNKGTIIIGTRDSLPNKRVTRVYDITDLLMPPANYRMPMFGFGGGYGMPYGGGYGGGYNGYGNRGYGNQSYYGNYGNQGYRSNNLPGIINSLYGRR